MSVFKKTTLYCSWLGVFGQFGRKNGKMSKVIQN